jgi:hypothetical protein
MPVNWPPTMATNPPPNLEIETVNDAPSTPVQVRTNPARNAQRKLLRSMGRRQYRKALQAMRRASKAGEQS